MNFSQFLSYNPESGLLFWKERGKAVFDSRYAGKEAGCRFLNKRDGKTYLQVRLNNKIYYGHRIAMSILGFDIEGMEVDHINGNGIDNRASNLRVVDRTENTRNKRLSRNNKSGASGVHRRENGKWCATIRHGKKRVHLGYFEDLSDAVNARRLAEKEMGFHENHGSVRPL